MTPGTPTIPLRRRKLYEEVVQNLEDMIRAGIYPRGTELPPEREFVEMFGVGRPAIREALFALERMGLIAIRRGKRPVVVTPTPELIIGELSGVARNFLADSEGMHNFQAARRLFEAALAREAARIATPKQIADLKAVLDRNFAAIGDQRAFELTDVQFHYAIAALHQNPIYVAVHQGLLEWLKDQRRATYNVPGAEKEAYAAHQRIYEAIAAKDPDRTEEEMRRHLDDVHKLYWRASQDVPST